jgi:signal transduction histidine kinase
VRLELRIEGSTLGLAVRDDGRGLDENAAAHGGGYGLTGMRERAQIGRGSLRVGAHDGAGTSVELTLPLR